MAPFPFLSLSAQAPAVTTTKPSSSLATKLPQPQPRSSSSQEAMFRSSKSLSTLASCESRPRYSPRLLQPARQRHKQHHRDGVHVLQLQVPDIVVEERVRLRWMRHPRRRRRRRAWQELHLRVSVPLRGGKRHGQRVLLRRRVLPDVDTGGRRRFRDQCRKLIRP